MKIRARKILLSLAAILIFSAFSADGATFTVNLTADAGDLTGDATCTLRDAVDDANNTAGSDTIIFDAGVFGTAQIMTLTGGELLITDSVDTNVILNQIAGGKK